MVFDFITISDRRTAQVIRDISEGSTPGVRFYFLVGVSTLIASLGLIANSPAVVIGAMLVAPLMTPIFGISLALVRGDHVLFRNALLAECVGILISVTTAWLLGSFPLALEVTSEMLARTKPNLFDLLVAVLAGSAGAYALVDESLSPALPGVAIATAIVPPLANTGLSIALGAYHGALGSFLLFVANFLSILIVSSAVFISAGMNYHFDPKNPKMFVRRFGLAIAGFLSVGIILTFSLVNIVKERSLSQTIESVLKGELADNYASELEKFIHAYENDKLYVLASVRGPSLFRPYEVKLIQNALAEKLKQPVELVVRNSIVRDMSATGSTSLVDMQNLDGFFLGGTMSIRDRIIRETEQMLWELLSDDPTANRLQNVDFGQLPSGPAVLVRITGHLPNPEDIRAIEQELRKRFDMDNLNLLAEVVETKLMSSQGNLLFGWSRYGAATPAKEERIRDVKKRVQDSFSGLSDLFPGEVYFNFQEGPAPLQILIEVGGGRYPTLKDLARVEKSLQQDDISPIEAFLWVRPDTVLTRQGFVPLQRLLSKKIKAHEETIKEMWKRID